jgi:hypothetical protein
MTSFSGLVILQALYQHLGLPERLRQCVRGLKYRGAYSASKILLILVTHLMLGWKRLRDLDYYRDDPLLKRVLGLCRVPDVSTLTRAMRRFDDKTEEEYRCLARELVVEQILSLRLKTVTMDFDGSVLSTKSRRTEGTAVGFNPKSKGSRSYYPLFATVAQLGQVFDYLHRPGNVHDSNGAIEFFLHCVEVLRAAGFSGRIESRMDAAFFSDEVVFALHHAGVEFTTSVPFERFSDLKGVVEARKKWRKIDGEWAYFEHSWKPKSWENGLRIIVYRQRKRVPTNGPIQLELWTPLHHEYEYKVVVTNKKTTARHILEFHNGRGSQEGLFGDLKSQAGMGYLPTRRLIPNRLYLTSVVLAHNLSRQLQILESPPQRPMTAKRACLWIVDRIDTLRKSVIQRAGRLTRPQGKLTLIMTANRKTRDRLLSLLDRIRQAA